MNDYGTLFKLETGFDFDADMSERVAHNPKIEAYNNGLAKKQRRQAAIMLELSLKDELN